MTAHQDQPDNTVTLLLHNMVAAKWAYDWSSSFDELADYTKVVEDDRWAWPAAKVGPYSQKRSHYRDVKKLSEWLF